MNRSNKRQSLKKWNHSKSQKGQHRDRDSRIKLKDAPRHKTWSAGQTSFDENPSQIV